MAKPKRQQYPPDEDFAPFNLEETFTRFLWMKESFEGRSAATISTYKQSMKKLKPYLSELTDADTLRSEVKEAVMKIYRPNDKGKQPSPASINVYLRPINSFLSWLEEEQLAPKHGDKLKLMKEPKKLIETLSAPDIQKLLTYKPSTFGSRRARIGAILAIGTGMRISELLDLRKAHIDMSGTNGGRILVFGKGSKERNVLFDNSVKVILYRYLQELPKEHDLVFCTKDGKPLSKRNFSRDLKRVAKLSDMEGNIYWHLLRHTFGTEYIGNDGNPLKLKDLMGHSSIRITERYVHTQTKHLKSDFDSRSPFSKFSMPRRGRTIPKFKTNEDKLKYLQLMKELEELTGTKES